MTRHHPPRLPRAAGRAAGPGPRRWRRPCPRRCPWPGRAAARRACSSRCRRRRCSRACCSVAKTGWYGQAGQSSGGLPRGGDRLGRGVAGEDAAHARHVELAEAVHLRLRLHRRCRRRAGRRRGPDRPPRSPRSARPSRRSARSFSMGSGWTGRASGARRPARPRARAGSETPVAMRPSARSPSRSRLSAALLGPGGDLGQLLRAARGARAARRPGSSPGRDVALEVGPRAARGSGSRGSTIDLEWHTRVVIRKRTGIVPPLRELHRA